MRVLMTADAVGGVWTYALDIARGASASGIETVLAVIGPPPKEAQRRQERSIPGLVLLESTAKLEWMDDPWRDVDRSGDWLLHLERTYEPDLVHLNGFAHGALPFRAKKLVVGHSCVLSWWEACKREPAPERFSTYRKRVQAGLAAADHVIAPTRAMLDSLVRHYGALPRAGVILNGANSEEFAPGTKEPAIFSAGRLWDEAKNVAALDRVAPDLPWPIGVAGEAGDRPPQNLQMLGSLGRDAMQDWYARASIYALPARYEPFGLSILEAALSGCALVLGDIATLRELWDGAAHFVDPDEPSQLQAILAHLCNDPGERQIWADHARARALQYSSGLMVRRYLDLYSQLAFDKESRIENPGHHGLEIRATGGALL